MLVCARETLQPEAALAVSGGVLRERLWKIRARAVIAAPAALDARCCSRTTIVRDHGWAGAATCMPMRSALPAVSEW